ncbi:hypothetical protein E3E36_04160 [Thermococcus sp. M36]|uniref:hypothetical protein n=1 Tax=Thermococcus sp. M36 TaxID=1638261 RepID=UPI0014391261|nr:hypothetical protein [Thermococcus sp. M36]NJE05346.1 hypothetical protein [Thermococcus sp. M36]
MKIRSLESFGLLPFFSYLLFGFLLYRVLDGFLGAGAPRETFTVLAGSVLFKVASGISLGLIMAVALTRHSAYTRKALGLWLGMLFPVASGYTGTTDFMGALGAGLLLGLVLIRRPTAQLKLAKALVPLPILIMMLPYLSQLFWMLDRGVILTELQTTVTYLRIVAVLLVGDVLIYIVLRHAAYDEETARESTLFLGPSKSGKTILSLGLFHAIVQGNVGGLKATSDSMVLVDKNEIAARLEDLYDTFVRAGFAGVKGTMRGWLSINIFDISRSPLDKFLYGMKDLSLEITDYAGEDLWNIAEILEDRTKYKERIVEAFKAETNPSDKKKFETFMKAVVYPKGLDRQARATYAATLRNRILKDLRKGAFDFRNYRRRIRWEELPEAIRTPLATAHTYRGIINADRIVFLLDGEKILYELYKKDPDFRTNLEYLESSNRKYYEKIKKIVEYLSDLDNKLGDPTLDKRIREPISRETLGHHLNAYRRIVLASRSKIRRESFVFLVTKADLIGAVFNSDVVSINLNRLKRRVLRALKKSVLFRNFLKNMNITEKDLSDKLMFSIVLPRKELEDSGSITPLSEDVLVRGLDDVIRWIRKAPRIKVLKEVLKP